MYIFTILQGPHCPCDGLGSGCDWIWDQGQNIVLLGLEVLRLVPVRVGESVEQLLAALHELLVVLVHVERWVWICSTKS